MLHHGLQDMLRWDHFFASIDSCGYSEVVGAILTPLLVVQC